jgi:DNA uptake protein ComE-like DNA-binding protein
MFRQLTYFTKGQKIGLVVLLCLLTVTVTISQLAHWFVKNRPVAQNAEFLAKYEEFRQQLRDKNMDYQYFSTADYYESQNYSVKNDYQLFTFDPNTLDSTGFAKLGIKPFVIRNILSYRNKVGKFKSVDDFAKIYGLKQSDFKTIKPYIKIDDTNLITDNNMQLIENKPLMTAKKSDTIIVELNTADTMQLKLLKGIGSGWAKAITAYRDKIGGYYSVNQLLEIKNFPIETLKNIEKQLKVDTNKITKIEVNRASIEYLQRHEYLNFYQAKAIYELRRKNKKISSLEELKTLKEFTGEQLEKIAYYLDFKDIKRNYGNNQ